MRRMLLVYPEFEPTMWGLEYTLPLIDKKSLVPPLGLLTIAALTPPSYELRLVDLNCEPLTDDALAWADMVLFSAMIPQKQALFRAAARSRRAGKFIVFGGPFPTSCPDECAPHCDALVLNEGELTWPLFLRDLEAGRPKQRYATEEKADITRTPPPRYDLADLSRYLHVPVQYSRGCPFLCEFCDITVLLGRQPRVKTPEQFLHELDVLHGTGYRGQVSVIDDNLIGNGKELRRLLPALQAWNRARGMPFHYFCEASTNLAEDDVLLKGLVDANFKLMFTGIESPSVESLKETRKFQNTRGSMLERVEKMQSAGLLVMAGFVLGFDNDPDDIFDLQERFIEASAIPNVYISPLVALPGTPLHERMVREGRLIPGEETNHTFIAGYSNMRFRIPLPAFMEGHRKLLERVYSPRAYFDRALAMLCRWPRARGWRGLWAQFAADARLLVNTLPTVKDARLGRSPAALPAGAVGRSRLWRGVLGIGRSVARFVRGLPPAVRREAARFVLRVAWKAPHRLPWVVHFICMELHYYRMMTEVLIPDLDRRRAALGSVPEPLLKVG